MSNNIRPATPEDAEKISDLIIPLCKKYIIDEFEAPAKKKFLLHHNHQAIKTHIIAGLHYFVLDDKKIHGVIGIKPPCHLFHLFVDDQLRGTGVGRQLWEFAKNFMCKQYHCEIISVNSSTHAVGFYEKLRFNKISGPRNQTGIISTPMEYYVE